MASIKEQWNELMNAVKNVFPKKGLYKEYSKDVKLSFFKPSNDELSLVIEGIDNEYYQFGDGKYPTHWEIYLNKDGTWKIC